jgi:acyl-CoA thioesterase-1
MHDGKGRYTMSCRSRMNSLLEIVLGLTVLCLLAHTHAHAQNQSGGIIVAFGDSLTSGYGVRPDKAYPAQLEKRLRASGYPWQVINAGVTGETSSEALRRVRSVLGLMPDIVVLETGLNDAMIGLDLRNTRRNIEEVVRILQEKRVTVILAGMQVPNENKRNPAFEELYPDIARKYNLTLIPFFLANVAGNPALNLYDGIHPTAEGYRQVTRTVYPYVKKAIGKRAAARPAPH